MPAPWQTRGASPRRNLPSQKPAPDPHQVNRAADLLAKEGMTVAPFGKTGMVQLIRDGRIEMTTNPGVVKAARAQAQAGGNLWGPPADPGPTEAAGGASEAISEGGAAWAGDGSRPMQDTMEGGL